MTAEEFKSKNPLDRFLESRGVKLVGAGNGKTTNRCALVEHKQGHLCVTVNLEKQLWNCCDCKSGGDVITWMALEQGKTSGQILKELGGNGNGGLYKKEQLDNPEIVATYDYRNVIGDLVYQAVRLNPKSFRQRRLVDGKWVYNMDGVTRVLYQLPDILKEDEVWICEGEKDCESLKQFGIVSTTNVGGAGKWLDAYTESLTGKDVVICGDNDKPGKEHVDLIFESIAGKVKSSRVVTVPPPSKDITDFIKTFPTPAEAQSAVEKLKSAAHVFHKGLKIPVYSMAELEARYRAFVSRLDQNSLNLGKWLPTLGRKVRPLVPGDMVLIVGDTGTGKTSMLSNIALCAHPMPTIMFEMELSAETMFERFVSLKLKLPAVEVEKTYQSGEEIGSKALDVSFRNLFICDEAGLSTVKLEEHIITSALKIGEPPRLVLLDYIQLMSGMGKRYEKASDNAEQLKIIAKRCNVILVVTSQVHRPSKSDDDDGGEITLHSGKDSGSLENSSRIVLGIWRDADDRNLMYLKVLKDTKGMSWKDPILCNYYGEKSLINERSSVGNYDNENQNQFKD